MKNPRSPGLRRFRRFCQLAAVGTCVALLAESASACPVWMEFYRPDDGGHGLTRRGPLHHITDGEETLTRNRITVTIRSFPGTTNDPNRQLVVKSFAYGGYGVRRAGEPGGHSPEGYRAGAVGPGESIFLSFTREVTLLAVVNFDKQHPGRQNFGERGAGHFYNVWRLSDQGRVKVATVDPLGPAYEGTVPEGTAPGTEQFSPVLAEFVPEAGQALRGTQFELQVPKTAADDFRWYLGGLLVQERACPEDQPPIPEPSTALLLAAGLAALGSARAGARG